MCIRDSAAEDARLRELYPLPEDEEEYGEEQYEGEEFTDNDSLETDQDIDISAKEEKKRWYNKSLFCVYAFHVEKHMTGKIF